MIEITQQWVYEPEACDCCEGWWNTIYSLTVNGEEFPHSFHYREDALAAGLAALGIEVVYIESPHPEEDSDD